MHDHDPFQISAFDRHPAFRVKQTSRSSQRSASLHQLRTRNPNVWPLPSLEGRSPAIVGTCDDGISLAYDRDTQLPSLLPVFAVSDGIVKYATKTARTHTLVLDHGDGYRSYYSGVDHPFVLPTSRRLTEHRVKAGDVLGYAKATSLHAEPLHFGLGRLDGRWHYVPVEAQDLMSRWLVLPWSEERETPPTNVQSFAA